MFFPFKGFLLLSLNNKPCLFSISFSGYIIYYNPPRFCVYISILTPNYLGSYTNTVSTQPQNTAGMTKKLSRASILYSNSNLTGIRYNYKANTTITILQNVSANVDKVRVNQTGRIAYINNSNYTNVAISQSKSTAVGQYKRFKGKTTLYSNSNLTGTRYSYLPQTQVKIVRRVNSNIDYVYVIKTGRYAYVSTNSYK